MASRTDVRSNLNGQQILQLSSTEGKSQMGNGCTDRLRLVEATQRLRVPVSAATEDLLSRKVGLDVVLHHGLIGRVAVPGSQYQHRSMQAVKM